MKIPTNPGAEFFRASIGVANRYCKKTYSKKYVVEPVGIADLT